MWEVMLWPLVASLVLPGILVYFGLHVVRREIIFIDLALAQIASLGVCVAALLHWEMEATRTFALSLGFTLLGAAIFSVARTSESKIPLEAIIGIAYVMAAAAAVLVLSRTPEGDEQIKNMLVGSILLVKWQEIVKAAVLFATVAALHAGFGRQVLAISNDPKRAARDGLKVRWWDFFFYATFGLVVTTFVRVAGVLLVFTYLIVPAVCGIRLARSFSAQWTVGYGIALAGGIGGLYASYRFDFPTGAAMVCTFGLIMVLVLAAKMIPHWAAKKT